MDDAQNDRRDQKYYSQREADLTLRAERNSYEQEYGRHTHANGDLHRELCAPANVDFRLVNQELIVVVQRGIVIDQVTVLVELHTATDRCRR